MVCVNFVKLSSFEKDLMACPCHLSCLTDLMKKPEIVKLQFCNLYFSPRYNLLNITYAEFFNIK